LIVTGTSTTTTAARGLYDDRELDAMMTAKLGAA
jgi:hypothetical protein